MPGQQRSFKEREITGSRTPRKYNVVLHNDDFTPMEFVVMILKDVFFKSDIDAWNLMMQVHRSESAIAGTYSYDLACSKAAKATAMARKAKHPLRLTVEPAEED